MTRNVLIGRLNPTQSVTWFRNNFVAF